MNDKNKIILTGDRPSGKLHLGHYTGSLSNRVDLQKTHQQYIIIADLQALTDNFEQSDIVRKNVFELVKDYLSVGIDPSRSIIFIQSMVPELAELTFYFMNIVSLGRLQRNPTVKLEIQQKNYTESLPVGFLCYPISQAADILGFQTDLVPVGQDQIPMIEQTNEIAEKFNRIYQTDCLKKVDFILGKNSRLSGTDGKSKASKSLGNAIFLSDSPDEIKSKIMSMYTDSAHIRVSDPGKVEGNVVFEYLRAFHLNQDEVKQLEQDYSKGGVGDIYLKNLLNKTLQDFLAPIKNQRDKIQNDQIIHILKEGALKARATVNSVLIKVKKAMNIDYFDDI